MSIFFFSSVPCVYVNCLLVLNPVWSISYHSVCPERYHFNYIWVWKRAPRCRTSGSCLHALCWRCRWWSLPGTTTSSTPGGRMSWGLWPKTDISATCLVSFRGSHLLFQVNKRHLVSRLEGCINRGRNPLFFDKKKVSSYTFFSLPSKSEAQIEEKQMLQPSRKTDEEWSV